MCSSASSWVRWGFIDGLRLGCWVWEARAVPLEAWWLAGDVRADRWPARTSGSGPGYVDRDGHRVGDDVPDGRVADEAGELGELVVVEVAGGLDRDTDVLVAGAN